jgi:hypothetical protein
MPIHKICSDDEGEHNAAENDREERSAAALIVVSQRNNPHLLEVPTVQRQASLTRNRLAVER